MEKCFISSNTRQLNDCKDNKILRQSNVNFKDLHGQKVGDWRVEGKTEQAYVARSIKYKRKFALCTVINI